MKRLLAVFALVALAACGQQEKAEEAPVAAPVANTAMGEGGAAGIGAALPMNVEAVTAAAPLFTVAPGADNTITLSLNNEVVFTLLPTQDGAHLRTIISSSTQARGPAGEIVGQTEMAQIPAAQQSFCTTERYNGKPAVACSTDAAGRFWRVFVLNDLYDGPVSPVEAIDFDYLLDAILVEMRWVAPAP
jgi:hypothetical protein